MLKKNERKIYDLEREYERKKLSKCYSFTSYL